MRTVSDLLSLAGAKLTPDAFPAAAGKPRTPDVPANSDPASFADVGVRIGEDNEVLRNLLIDTSHQLSAIDDLKQTFAKLVDPLNNVLTTLENERADNASSRGALAAIRGSHEALRAEFQGLEKRSSEQASDNDRLTRDLASAMQRTRGLEENNAKLSSEITAVRTAMAMLVKQLGEETGNVRGLSEEKGLLAQRAAAADKRIIGLEAELSHARERLSLLENDKDTLQTALDTTLMESSRTSRRLTETENSLSESRSALQQMEKRLAAAEAERNKLAAACDEANERRQNEVRALELKLEASRSHSEAQEKLAAGVRQSLLARNEEIRAAEARLLEAAAARIDAEKKVESLTAACDGWDQQVKKLEQDVAGLTERCRILSEAQTVSEGSLVHAREKIKSLTGQVEQLQSEAAANRAKTEEDIVQLNATIEHERCERGLAEGALETMRNDYARLQRQMAEERSMRRVDHQRRMVAPRPAS